MGEEKLRMGKFPPSACVGFFLIVLAFLLVRCDVRCVLEFSFRSVSDRYVGIEVHVLFGLNASVRW